MTEPVSRYPSNDRSLSGQIDAQLALLIADTSSARFKKDTEDKVKELKNLLIEYILANMTGDKEQTKGIQKQIDGVLAAFNHEEALFKEAHALIRDIQANPSGENAATLIALEQLNEEIDNLAPSG